jgi:uncharacterized membrane protein
MKTKTRKVQNPILANVSSLDVFPVQESALSVSVEISRNLFASTPFSSRESKLRVQISNGGENVLENLSIEAIAPEGTQLVDPGILFGNQRRHVRLPRLNSKKSVTYKLGIRAGEDFRSGILEIQIREIDIYAPKVPISMKIGLTAS